MAGTVHAPSREASSAEDPSPQPARPLPRIAVVLGFAGRVLITTGIVVLMFVVYELWGTNIREARAQDGLRDDLEERFIDARAALGSFGFETADDLSRPDVRDPGTTVDTTVPPATATDPEEPPEPVGRVLPVGAEKEMLEFFLPPEGEAVARIEIPDLGVDKVVVKGVQVADLRKGPGHYPDTRQIGFVGNTAIAGHRTTYGAPFNRIDELLPGDEIRLTSILGTFVYRVMDPLTAYPDHADEVDELGEGHIIVRPSDTWVLGDFGDNRVTLTACHPKLSSRQRIIVAAELVGEPVLLESFVSTDPDEETATPEIVGEDTGQEPNEDPVDESEAEPRSEPDDGSIEDLLLPFRSPDNESTSSLDEGLDGDQGAIPGATAWMVGAIALWVTGGIIARRCAEALPKRLLMRGAWLMPALVCLWFSFEGIDRALPAG